MNKGFILIVFAFALTGYCDTVSIAPSRYNVSADGTECCSVIDSSGSCIGLKKKKEVRRSCHFKMKDSVFNFEFEFFSLSGGNPKNSIRVREDTLIIRRQVTGSYVKAGYIFKAKGEVLNWKPQKAFSVRVDDLKGDSLIRNWKNDRIRILDLKMGSNGNSIK